MLFAEGSADALTWTAVVASIVSLVGNLVQAIMNAKVKSVEAANNVRIAVLELSLENCKREHQESEARIAKLEAKLETS